jgi:hypothetical protein
VISTQAVVLGQPEGTSLKGVMAGECAQEGLRETSGGTCVGHFLVSQRARVPADGRTEGPLCVPGLGELLSCDTEEQTLNRFWNYWEIGKFATACTQYICAMRDRKLPGASPERIMESVPPCLRRTFQASRARCLFCFVIQT